MTDKPKKKRLWQLDPSVFQPGPGAGFLERHILSRLRQIVKYSLYSLALVYPVVLVSLGVIYGGLVFWTSLAGSVGLIWLVLKKAGYSNNFAGWDMSSRKWFLGLIAGFAMTLGLFYGLFQLKTDIAPVVVGVLATALILGIWRISNR